MSGLFLILFLGLQLSTSQECRGYMSCNACLEDPNCGWCADLSVCVPGSSSGPSHGTCNGWDFWHCSSPPPPSPSDWKTFGGSASHASFRPISFSNATRLWNTTFSTGPNSASIVLGSTVYGGTYANNVLYLVGLSLKDGSVVAKINLGQASSYSTPSASADGTLIAVQTVGINEGLTTFVIDVKKAEVSWVGTQQSQWANYPYGPLFTPNNTLYYFSGEYYGKMSAYYGNGTAIFDVQVYAPYTDASTPSVWLNASSNNQNLIYWTTAPSNDMAYFGGVDALTGASVFRVNLNASWDGYSTETVPVIADSGIALVTTRRSGGILNLYAIDLKIQNQTWEVNCSQPFVNTVDLPDYSPATDGKVVALVCSSTLEIYDLETGDKKQSIPCISCSGQPIITSSHYLVAFKIGATNNGVVSINRSNLQQNIISTNTNNVLPKLAVAGTTLIVTRLYGGVEVYALN